MGYSAGVLTDEQIQTLGKLQISNIFQVLGSDINNFMGFYRANFPNSTVFPKLHILEDHVQQWLQHWHIGFGIMGEQGAESLYAHIKKLERQYFGVANELERLKYNIVKEHNLQSSPQP